MTPTVRVSHPSRLAFAGLLGLTAVAVVAWPHARHALAAPPPVIARPAPPPGALPGVQAGRIEAVFVLDTTGSMGGLIEAAKEKIWSIASSMAQAQGGVDLRIGLVAYRDRGDEYVTRVVDLSGDLDQVYATLMDFQADGGGDGPESVNQALADAVTRISWSQGPGTYRTVFLVGDAPPHTDYGDTPLAQSVRTATARGITVNAIQCGTQADTTRVWQQVADAGQGRYFQVGQDGSALAMDTPYDDRLAALSRELDATRLGYGDAATRARQERKAAATDKLEAAATVGAKARRAVFNASAAGTGNLAGEGDLVADVRAGRVTLEAVPEAQLPPALRDLPAERRAQAVHDAGARRDALKDEINQLARQRADYAEKEVAARGGAEASLDAQVYRTVREQAGKAGLSYAPASAPAY